MNFLSKLRAAFFSIGASFYFGAKSFFSSYFTSSDSKINPASGSKRAAPGQKQFAHQKGHDLKIGDMSAVERGELCKNNENSFLHHLVERTLQDLATKNHDKISAKTLGVTASYNDEGRAFHRPQHIFQPLYPKLLDAISKNQDLNKWQKIAVIAAAYHDVEYHVDINSKSPFGVNVIKQAFLDKGLSNDTLKKEGVIFSEIFGKLPAEQQVGDWALIAKIFDLPRKDASGKEMPVKFSGPPLNEFLSACRFMSDMRQLGVADDLVLSGLVHIQMTEPFMAQHPEHLYAQTVAIADKFGVTDKHSILAMINSAAEMANGDIDNLLSSKIWRHIEGDLLMAPEVRGNASFAEKKSGYYKEFSDFWFADQVRQFIKEDRLAEPISRFDAAGNFVAGRDQTYYTKKMQQAKVNLVVESIYKTALTIAYMPDKPDKQPSIPKGLAEFLENELAQDKTAEYQKLAQEHLGVAISKGIIDPALHKEANAALGMISNDFDSLKKMVTGAVEIKKQEPVQGEWVQRFGQANRDQDAGIASRVRNSGIEGGAFSLT